MMQKVFDIMLLVFSIKYDSGGQKQTKGLENNNTKWAKQKRPLAAQNHINTLK